MVFISPLRLQRKQFRIPHVESMLDGRSTACGWISRSWEASLTSSCCSRSRLGGDSLLHARLINFEEVHIATYTRLSKSLKWRELFSTAHLTWDRPSRWDDLEPSSNSDVKELDPPLNQPVVYQRVERLLPNGLRIPCWSMGRMSSPGPWRLSHERRLDDVNERRKVYRRTVKPAKDTKPSYEPTFALIRDARARRDGTYYPKPRADRPDYPGAHAIPVSRGGSTSMTYPRYGVPCLLKSRKQLT